MIEYVGGFLFSEDRRWVALIEKQKPAWMAGKLNAIGGKIEAGETPLTAMAREFDEEAGMVGIDWQPTAVLQGPDFVCHFFAAFSHDMFLIESQEDEQVDLYEVEGCLTGVHPVMSNLPTLMSIALDRSGITKPVILTDAVSQERKWA